MAYYVGVRRRLWSTVRSIAWITAGAGFLAATGCSSSEEAAKKQPPAAPDKTPAIFKVNLDTSKGAIVVEVHRDWAPIGVDHLYSLVKSGYYDGNRFFRMTRSYAQFGISGDPKMNGLWSNAY